MYFLRPEGKPGRCRLVAREPGSRRRPVVLPDEPETGEARRGESGGGGGGRIAESGSSPTVLARPSPARRDGAGDSAASRRSLAGPSDCLTREGRPRGERGKGGGWASPNAGHRDRNFRKPGCCRLVAREPASRPVGPPDKRGEARREGRAGGGGGSSPRLFPPASREGRHYFIISASNAYETAQRLLTRLPPPDL